METGGAEWCPGEPRRPVRARGGDLLSAWCGATWGPRRCGGRARRSAQRGGGRAVLGSSVRKKVANPDCDAWGGKDGVCGDRVCHFFSFPPPSSNARLCLVLGGREIFGRPNARLWAFWEVKGKFWAGFSFLFSRPHKSTGDDLPLDYFSYV
jgi:hypothetical protein